MARTTVSELQARIAALEAEKRTVTEVMQEIAKRDAQRIAALKLIATLVADTLSDG